MTAVATVTPIRREPQDRRLRPAEAHRVAQAAREAGLAPGAARAVLALMLRLARGPEFEVERRTGWFAREVGCFHRTARRALDELEASGIIQVVTKGGGRRVTNYRVNVELALVVAGDLPESSPVNHPVHTGELPVLQGEPPHREGGQNDPPAGSKRPPSGVKMTPLYARAPAPSPCSPLERGVPSPSEGTSPRRGSPPAAGARVPPSATPPRDRCPHGRTPAQGGCRQCGTSPRTKAKTDTAEQEREARLAARRAEADAERARLAEDPPAPMPDEVRRALRKGKK